MRKDFSRRPGEHIVTWLLRCWDNRASSLELEGKEAKQLGSLSREGGIDKAIGKGAQALSLWRRLLSAMKERYPFKEDVVYRPGKWTTMEKSIQYLRELAMLGVTYGDLDNEQLSKDPDEVQCTRPTWQKLVRSAPPSCASSLAILTWKDEEGPTVDEVASQLREYEESISSSLVSAVEKLVQQLKEDRSYSPPVRSSISAIRSRHSSAQERGYRGYTPRGTIWFYLRDHGEDMRKWDGKPTSTLEARVEERDNRVYWTVWIRWPGTQEYRALVDDGAQCTLMPSSYTGAEPIRISGVTGGSQQLTVLEAEVSLTGNEWQKHPIVTGPEAPCILGIDYLRRGYFKDPKGYRWAFGIAALEMEEIKQLSTLPRLSEDPSVVGLLRVEEQQVPIATTTVHRRQYRTNRDSLIPIHKLIRRLESQGVISKTRSPFNSPIWPVQKCNGEWRLTVDYRGLNEVTPPLSAAVPDTLELQYELGSKAAKWYATTDIANAFFSIPLAAECRPQFAFAWRGGWKHSPTICHGLIQTALEQGEAPEHLQYIDDIIVWGNTAEEVFEKGKKIVQILLKASFAIKQSKVKGPAQDILSCPVKGLSWFSFCRSGRRTQSNEESQWTIKGHLVQPPSNEQGHLQLKQPDLSPVQPDLECFQGWGIHHLSGQPVPVSHHPHLLKGCNKVSPEPSLLQAEQPQLSQPFFIGEVFQPSDHFCGLPLDPLQQVHVFLVLRAPELDAVLQDTIGFLGCKCTLLAHVQLFIYLYIPKAALNPFIPQSVLILGIASTQVQDLALGLVEPHEVHMGPLLGLVQVPLDGIPSLRRVNRTTQLGVICKFAEGALDPAVYVIDEDIK
ncbi:hypothetical protein QYF61_012610 [Mycteria americana]|uniref:ribonuclease H n=1 Tax=Mycteria americana TaxID=33587 RepID=A0AAN7MJ25_MYCAM|nr:hypothetical protein QYF61_012610 [Mycteria americana]